MSKKRNFVLGIVIGVLAFIVIGISVFSYGLKAYNWDSPMVKSITKVIPYKAMKVNGNVYRYHEYLDDFDAYKQSMSTQPAEQQIADEELKKMVLQTQIDSALLEDLADDYEIELTEEDYDKAFQQVLGLTDLSDEALEEFEGFTQETYGWDLETYKEKVIRLYVLSQKLSAKLVSDLESEENKAVYEEMESVYNELENGGDFAELAMLNSEDGSAPEGGDLGWFSEDMMVEEFMTEVKKLEVGEYSDVFMTPYGYHIVKLMDQRENEDTGVTEYKASHIIKLAKGLDAYLEELRKDADIKVYIKGYSKEDLLNLEQ